MCCALSRCCSPWRMLGDALHGDVLGGSGLLAAELVVGVHGRPRVAHDVRAEAQRGRARRALHCRVRPLPCCVTPVCAVRRRVWPVP